MIVMSDAFSPEELVGRRADGRLLDERAQDLPPSLDAPPPPAPVRAGERLVAIGVTLTAGSLIVGLALLALGIVETLASGWDAGGLAALIVGAVLVATHWGWVHVAEWRAGGLRARRDAELQARRHAWLDQVQPYARWEVSTHAADDGTITIAMTRYLPTPIGDDRFTFARRVQTAETYSGDEPGATIAERAELLRRQAARDTARERERYRAAADARETDALRTRSERELTDARRAASRALSERINTNLGDPPLTE